ncbi:hypothetical protein GCM10011410_26960 [Hoyosella rhizosphaerae]|uniref:DUF5130 domain-containing protein n=1 Tax=Hoyosella rhizosphaerae TaxID=1755582 RepID=A0A916UIU1_9ACTN|nr:hypothetical protein GCM10011410_26960 [Hoyosella rhizosphaerae]
MQHGEVAIETTVRPENLPLGAVHTASGRISAVRFLDEPVDKLPFDKFDRIRLDEALVNATRATGMNFTIYLGDLGAESNDTAFELLDSLDDSAHSVLISVSPGERKIEVVSGSAVAHKATDRICQLGITAALPSFREGHLLDGLVSAVKVMAAATTPVRA